ncbi:MAG: helix-turn-helix domain-containing protein [Planctomycetota bacterium]
MGTSLERVGYYVSPLGGATNPAPIVEGKLLFEVITAGRVYSPDGEHLRGAGWVFCHRGGTETIWRSEADEHYECLVLNFDGSTATPREEWPRSFSWGESESAVTFAHEMLTAFHHTNVPRDILGNLIWSQLRFRLDSFRRREVRREIPPRVSRAMAYMDRFYEQELRIEELAAQASLSPSHLHARFRSHVGMTPHQYLIEQRMKVARHRLVTTPDPIKAIAQQVGYANTENFCRAFKRRFKTTAAAYRRKYTVH